MLSSVKSLAWRLYDEALPITEALESFAPPSVKEQFQVLSYGDALIKHPDLYWTRLRAKFYNFANSLPAFLPAALHFHIGEGLRQQQRAQLYRMELNYIHGLPRYVLLGFVTPRHVDAPPVAIPLDCWDGDFDWVRHTLRAGSLAFEGLRIANLVTLPATLTAEWVDALNTPAGGSAAAPAPKKGTANKPGPKSAEVPICEAVDQLFPNPEFRTAPYKTKLAMVLLHLRGRDPGLDGLLETAKPKTLEGHISRRIRALQGQPDDGSALR